MKRALAAVGLLAGFAVLAPASSALAQSGGVRGKVVDTEGSPVAEAQVVIEFRGGLNQKWELTSNKKGEYVQLGLRAGPYRVTASKEGYQPGTIDITVGIGAAYVPEVVLNPLGASEHTAEIQAKFTEAVELARADKLDEAEAAFKEVLEIRPDIAEAHQNLAYVYEKRQDWASAEASYLAALDLRPGSTELISSLAKVYQNSGQNDKAMELLSQLEGADAADGRAQLNKGVVLLDAGNSEEAQAAFEAALAAEPPVAEAHYYLGTILVGQGKVPEAVEHLEAYLASNPADGPNKETAQGLLQALK